MKVIDVESSKMYKKSKKKKTVKKSKKNFTTSERKIEGNANKSVYGSDITYLPVKYIFMGLLYLSGF